MLARIGKLLASVRTPKHRRQDVTYRHVRQWALFMVLVVILVCLLCSLPLALMRAWNHLICVLLWSALALFVIWVARRPAPPKMFLRMLLVFMLVLPFWMQYTFGGLARGNYMAALAVLVLPLYTLAVDDRQVDALWVGSTARGWCCACGWRPSWTSTFRRTGWPSFTGCSFCWAGG